MPIAVRNGSWPTTCAGESKKEVEARARDASQVSGVSPTIPLRQIGRSDRFLTRAPLLPG